MSIDPESARAASDGLSLAAKIAGMFAAFIGGIVTATWAVASKINGFDSRLCAVEKSHGEVAKRIDGKLDRLHERIDEILLKGAGKDDN